VIAPIPGRFALATALVDLWNHPHSERFLRFATYATRCAQRRLAVDVLELELAPTGGKERA
jgi:hypothetical protein